MGFKNFKLNVLFRVILLTVCIFIFVYLFNNKSFFITPVIFAGVIIYLVYNLIHYVEITNRDLTGFLQSIRFGDFTRTFKANKLGGSFDDVQKAFDDVIADFQKIRAEKEEHYFYLQNVIQHIGIGIIAYQKNGEVELINNAAKKIFQVYNLKNINSLNSWSRQMTETLLSIKAGENALIKVQEEDELLQLSVYATEFKVSERSIILVSIKNIQTELEEKEMESWQKLIRVLTHEIMNSIAPIASLTSTANIMAEEIAEAASDSGQSATDIDMISDIQHALKTIHKRSTGLIHFVETYRNLTKIPKPNFSIFPVKKMFDNIYDLLEVELNKKNVECVIDIKPPGLEMTADEQLIEQVIINLLKNSIHAVDNQPDATVQLRAFLSKRGRVTIQVIDNGKGIIQEVLDKIFIPFFTTKPNGSGIGLSLSKQILRLHGGAITVKSIPEKETCFTITF